MTNGPREQPTGQKGKVSGPIGWSADQPMGPIASNLPCGGFSLGAQVGSVQLTQWLPPINIREAVNNTTHQHTLTSSLELGVLPPRCFRQPRGVEDQEESEEESREVSDLSTLFSACTLTDAYSVVSIRDFLIQNQSLVVSYFFCLILIEYMLRVAFDPSLRLRIEKDNLGHGEDQYRIAQTWCLGQTLPLICLILPRFVEVQIGEKRHYWRPS